MVGADVVKKRKQSSKDDSLASVDVAMKSINESDYDRKCRVEQVQSMEGMSSTKRRKKRKVAQATGAHNLETAPMLLEKNKVRRKLKKLPKTSLGPTVAESKVGDASSVTAALSCTTKAREYEMTPDDDEAPPIPEKTHKLGKRKRTLSSKNRSDTKNSAGKCRSKPVKQKVPEGYHNQTETEAPLEGIMHEGTMYLVDESKRAFSSTRDSQGRLVQVGCVDKAGERVVLAGSNPENDAGSTGHVPEQTPSTTFGDARSMDGSQEVDGDADSTGRKRRKRKKAKKGKKQEGKRADEGSAQAARSGEGSSANEGATSPISPPVGTVKYPFEVEDCDHCETSEQAYGDIAPLLVALAKELGKRPCELGIYDPYYCQGSSVKRLESVGFPSVYNRNEDFYKVWREETIPEHDVLVTNPPFSGDHVPSILRFCSRAGRKPWFLLLPNFVYLKVQLLQSAGVKGEGEERREKNIAFQYLLVCLPRRRGAHIQGSSLLQRRVAQARSCQEVLLGPDSCDGENDGYTPMSLSVLKSPQQLSRDGLYPLKTRMGNRVGSRVKRCSAAVRWSFDESPASVISRIDSFFAQNTVCV